MLRRILAVLALVSGAVLFAPSVVRAQNPDPASQIINTLVGAGFDVVDVGHFPDAQRNPDPNTVFAEMETVTTDFNDRYILNQTLLGFQALTKYYAGVPNDIVVLHYDHWLFFFVTTPQDWDDFVSKRVTLSDYWGNIRNQVRIYDTTQQKYITAKDFLSQNQTNKNQTNKDFSGSAKSPLPPVNTNPNAQAENIVLEPSTTYLPADGASQAYLLATLTDKDFAGLPGRGVNFSFEVRGQDERPLPTAQTDAFGTARSKIASSRPLANVLVRAATSTLDASTQIIVSAAPGKEVAKQVQAVKDGLTAQGYSDVDADYGEYTGPAGNIIRQGIAAVRVTSKSFDRAVYSQLFRMMGTLRTVMPDASFLRPLLLYAAADGHDYTLLFTMRADIWDAYIRGEIGENQLWSSLSYDGAVNENGVRTNDKDFLSKNFSGSNQARVSSAARSVESALTTEAWGDDLTVGSFLVPVGGYVDTFNVSELSGSANGFSLYATPDFKTPIYTYNKGDETGLKALRLEEGQYIITVNGTTPPAKIVLQFVEHLVR